MRGKCLCGSVRFELSGVIPNLAIAALFRLETGVKQPEALGLYRKLGYHERGPFGAYRPDPLSVFMEKQALDDD